MAWSSIFGDYIFSPLLCPCKKKTWQKLQIGPALILRGCKYFLCPCNFKRRNWMTTCISNMRNCFFFSSHFFFFFRLLRRVVLTYISSYAINKTEFYNHNMTGKYWLILTKWATRQQQSSRNFCDHVHLKYGTNWLVYKEEIRLCMHVHELTRDQLMIEIDRVRTKSRNGSYIYICFHRSCWRKIWSRNSLLGEKKICRQPAPRYLAFDQLSPPSL